ncbi:hypothetical protein V1277_004692 [Bradyrhizobium sp. AZCC 1588]
MPKAASPGGLFYWTMHLRRNYSVAILILKIVYLLFGPQLLPWLLPAPSQGSDGSSGCV